jgi:hypothetical protein
MVLLMRVFVLMLSVTLQLSWLKLHVDGWCFAAHASGMLEQVLPKDPRVCEWYH